MLSGPKTWFSVNQRLKSPVYENVKQNSTNLFESNLVMVHEPRRTHNGQAPFAGDPYVQVAYVNLRPQRLCVV